MFSFIIIYKEFEIIAEKNITSFLGIKSYSAKRSKFSPKAFNKRFEYEVSLRQELTNNIQIYIYNYTIFSFFIMGFQC